METKTFELQYCIGVGVGVAVKKRADIAHAFAPAPPSPDNNVIPTEGDFVKIPYRLLTSGNVVGKNSYKATEFPIDVLKKALPLFEGVKAFLNHNTWDVECAIGTVNDVMWEDAFADGGGKSIPAGIVGYFTIDSKTEDGADYIRMMVGAPDANPPIPPTFDACSVGIRFSYIPSHVLPNDKDFFDVIGDIAPDGTMYRMIATEILEVREVSLVSYGADEHAKNRVPIMGVKTGASAQFCLADERLTPAHKGYLLFDARFSEGDIERVPQQKSEIDFTETEAYKTIQAAIECLKKELAEKNTAYADTFVKLGEERGAHIALQSKYAALEAQVQILTSEKEALASMAAHGETYIEELQKEALRLYGIASGATSDVFSDMISGLKDVDKLRTLCEEWTRKVDDKHPAKCTNCGGSFSRQSAAQGGAESDANAKSNNKELKNQYY